ncbi:hypothetical protein [Novosphingobium sp.]|uniref:hypothetical protein n=1 Tax=Novosphingobium sp. TaxID=1874826 RepID=UPI0025F38D16|nr:hypothetical protein [Novosphingobium sp.]
MTDTTTIQPARRARRMAREVYASTLPGTIAPAAAGDGVAGSNKASASDSSGEARTTKAAQVLALLQRTEGASLDDLVTLTRWLDL